jgi:hypothetical protein
MALNDRSRRRARNKTRNKAQELMGQIKETAGRSYRQELWIDFSA